MRPPIKGSSILVTGGAGFIGSHLVDRLQDLGAREVVVIDNMFLGSEANLAGALEQGAVLYKDDAEIASSLEYIFSRHDIDIVFNAATKALNYSFVNPSNAFNTNVNVVMNLLELQRKGSFQTLCHFSTSEVYGTAVYEPMDEKHPINPTTTYAAGKAAADIALQSWVRMCDLDAFIVRPFNNYGPRQNYKGYLAGVIPITAWKILNGLPPEIHGGGNQTRDFIFVLDTVDAIVKLYDRLAPGESVNISTDGQISIRDVIHKITRNMGYQGEILEKPARKADVECHNASNAKVRGMIDYRLTPFDQGLSETLAWYRDNIR
ncbi:NAD-dependent epimerase/dehydratase family protein [Geomonas azotofigens]|uniref:NAD-dependent epimerase/dehydratase family protein n=1 Tax=Geomonas azotofigens TaxID=2843196 RepID=UPI001C124595|nr:NAD-dependent epimerase/dehydratase family protein [Geomonas azotofigens]MBU5613372.1 NAD-dependent epimerase/dehydratase family protein [Geomonas azotofigens]